MTRFYVRDKDLKKETATLFIRVAFVCCFHNMADSLFVVLSLEITFYLVNGFTTDAEILIGEFLDGHSDELRRGTGYSRRRSREPFNQLSLLLCG